MPDILFATAPDGTRLPVIDITSPAFAVPDETAWRAEKSRYFRDEQARSEGGLFDYGADAEIVAVLKLLAQRVDAVVGSVTTADEETRQMYRGGAKVILRGLAAFGRLAEAGGYRIARTLPAPFSDQVLLTRA